MPPGSDETVDFSAQARWVNELAAKGRRPSGTGTPPGDGGSGDLGHRVDAIEADLKDLKSDVKSLMKDTGAIKERLAGIEGRLSNLPTTFQMLTWFVGIALGLVGLVFTIARTVGTH